MTVTVDCPTCGKHYRIDAKFAGRRVQCKGCGTAMIVPAPAAVAAPQPVAVAAPPVSALWPPPPPPPVAPPPYYGTPMPVRALEYGQDVERSQYVSFDGEEWVDRIVPWAVLAAFLGSIIIGSIMSVRGLMTRATATGSPQAFLVGFVVARALGPLFLVFAIWAPLSLLGVFIASRIMKFTNRPLLYWRCAVTMMTPLALIFMLGGIDPRHLRDGPVWWLTLVPMFGVLWLMLRLRLAPFAVAAGFVLVFAIAGPVLLVFLLAIPFVMAGRSGPRATISPPPTFRTPSVVRPLATPGSPSSSSPAISRPAGVPTNRPVLELQLKQVGAALKSYAVTHGGAYPKSLKDLVADGGLSAADAEPLGASAWVYNSRGLSDPLPAEFVLVHDVGGNDSQRTCLFGDGRVRTIAMGDWSKYLKDSNDAARKARGR